MTFREELYSHKTIEANKGTPYDPDHAAGAFLRLVSPDYVKDSHFIYTDCDVMFVNDPSRFYKFPQYIAACGETIVNGDVTDAQSAFNSGVMIINREGFLSRRDELIAVIRSNNFYFKQHQSYDQTMINMVFRGEWETLAAELNWRPFQGINPNAGIVHFHGPKPHRIAEIFAGHAIGDEASVMSSLAFKHRLEYEVYLKQYQAYLSTAQRGDQVAQ